MKILLFGRGVISTQYAWALENAGNEVTFYVRPGRIAEYGPTVDLNILDTRKNIKGIKIKHEWKITMIDDLNANHDYELIILSVQHYHFKDAVDFLANKIGSATVLVFNNLWEEPQQAVHKLPEGQLVWGFPMAGGGFDDKGTLNGALLDHIYMGTLGVVQSQRSEAVANLFRASYFKIKESKDFRSWLFGHFVFNAALHLEAARSNTGLISLEAMKTTTFWKNVVLNGKELIPLLKLRKVDLDAASDLKMFNLPPWLLAIIMNLVIKWVPALRIILTSHSNPIEIKSYVQDVISKAKEINIHLPRYEHSGNAE
ncbi:ketopantoate reductase [Pedobacter petrophilus]|uniref:Ketopantoate reductase n=2 Tax=Pedobacter TaxID=84567 RepID=A0A7K0G3X2_9SPHI|nr:2-dehydropantoate 2-reductase N-terminal domain-containing protein [Pedobacter petrophilus]MRX78505.1 ketopantoate reductase [Pedobacter petrophilus]